MGLECKQLQTVQKTISKMKLLFFFLFAGDGLIKNQAVFSTRKELDPVWHCQHSTQLITITTTGSCLVMWIAKNKESMHARTIQTSWDSISSQTSLMKALLMLLLAPCLPPLAWHIASLRLNSPFWRFWSVKGAFVAKDHLRTQFLNSK